MHVTTFHRPPNGLAEARPDQCLTRGFEPELFSELESTQAINATTHLLTTGALFDVARWVRKATFATSYCEAAGRVYVVAGKAIKYGVPGLKPRTLKLKMKKSTITAVAVRGNEVFLGTDKGGVEIHDLLDRRTVSKVAFEVRVINRNDSAAIKGLYWFGLRLLIATAEGLYDRQGQRVYEGSVVHQPADISSLLLRNSEVYWLVNRNVTRLDLGEIAEDTTPQFVTPSLLAVARPNNTVSIINLTNGATDTTLSFDQPVYHIAGGNGVLYINPKGCELYRWVPDNFSTP